MHLASLKSQYTMSKLTPYLCITLWFIIVFIVILKPDISPSIYLSGITIVAAGSIGVILRARTLRVVGVVCLVGGGISLLCCAVLSVGVSFIYQLGLGAEASDMAMIDAGLFLLSGAIAITLGTAQKIGHNRTTSNPTPGTEKGISTFVEGKRGR